MFRRVVIKLLVGWSIGPTVGFMPFSEARAQNPHDYALYQATVMAQTKITEAAMAKSDDALSSVFTRALLEIHLYKQKYNISDEIAKNPCQRSYEELAVSAGYLSSYINPNRQLSGPNDRGGDGREADKWWASHKEAQAECERLLKLPQSKPVGPDRLTSIVPR